MMLRACLESDWLVDLTVYSVIAIDRLANNLSLLAFLDNRFVVEQTLKFDQ